MLSKINQEALYRIPVLIPPPTEQYLIASTLNASFEHAERVYEELKRIPRLIERYKRANLGTAAATSNSTAIPGWIINPQNSE